jgi:hypothetical protein
MLLFRQLYGVNSVAIHTGGTCMFRDPPQGFRTCLAGALSSFMLTVVLRREEYRLYLENPPTNNPKNTGDDGPEDSGG